MLQKKSLKAWLLASFLHILKLKKYCKDSNTPEKMGFNKFTYPPTPNSEQPTTDHRVPTRNNQPLTIYPSPPPPEPTSYQPPIHRPNDQRPYRQDYF